MKIKKNVKPHSGTPAPVCKRMIDVMASLEKIATGNKMSAGVVEAGLATAKTFKELELRTQQA